MNNGFTMYRLYVRFIIWPARYMSHSHMIVQKRYRESVSPDPAIESGLLAMVDGRYT